jgi:hypothetical protein
MTTKQQRRPLGQFAAIIAGLGVIGLTIGYLASLAGSSQLCRLIELTAGPFLILSFAGIDCWAIRIPHRGVATRTARSARVNHDAEIELATSTI